MALCAVFKKKDPYVEEVKANVLDKPENFVKETVCRQLEQPSKIQMNCFGQMPWIAHDLFDQSLILEKPEMFYQVLEGSEQVFLAPPVLMALCLQRYDLVMPLLEAGYSTIYENEDNGISELEGRCVVGECSYRFTLGQFLMCDPDLPEELRLTLWQRIAKEKKERAKEKKCPRSKVISFINFNFEKNICGLLIDSRKGEFGIYQKTLIRTLEMIAKKRPRYLKNILNPDFGLFLANIDSKAQFQIIQILLKYVIRTNDQKIKLMQLHARPFELFGETNANIRQMAFFYERLEPHYNADELLQEVFFEGLVKDYMYWCSNVDSELTQLFDLPREKKIKSLIEKYTPKDLSLKRIFKIIGILDVSLTEFSVDPDRLQYALRFYKEITGKPTILNDTFSFCTKPPKAGVRKLIDKNTVYIEAEQVKCWIEYVEQFSFDDTKPLNCLQRSILNHCGEDLLVYTLKRGLFRGKHVEEAVSYCMKNEKSQNLVPCIMAFSN